MKNTFGSALALTIFGESHGRAIGGVLDGMAAGVPVDEEFIAACMDKRRARGDGLSTPRVEADKVQLLSGVVNGHTTGTAIALMIENQNTRSGDYAKTADLLRPGHADYTAYAKYHGFQDARGGEGPEGDSVGGILETAILGLPAGVGEPYFDSVESLISHMAFSVPAVKGIEFGTGFGFADLKGSEANDAFRMKGDSVVTATNHNAGINGGITNGMPVVFRTAVKPTPSIYKEQETVDYIAKQDAPLSIQGRHDPCIVPRAAIVQTCAAALAVGDLMTARYGTAWMERPTSYRREGL